MAAKKATRARASSSCRIFGWHFGAVHPLAWSCWSAIQRPPHLSFQHCNFGLISSLLLPLRSVTELSAPLLLVWRAHVEHRQSPKQTLPRDQHRLPTPPRASPPLRVCNSRQSTRPPFLSLSSPSPITAMVIKRFSDLTKKVPSNPFKNFGSSSSEAARPAAASEEDVGSGLDTPEANVGRAVVSPLEARCRWGNMLMCLNRDSSANLAGRTMW
jgi:hypothetical protein